MSLATTIPFELISLLAKQSTALDGLKESTSVRLRWSKFKNAYAGFIFSDFFSPGF
jgi:hypothetical protein